MSRPCTSLSEQIRWRHIETACLIEATARKPGNVHPARSFADLTYDDFVRSAALIAPVLAEAPRRPIGESVWQAVSAVRKEVGQNTNLGIVLLLAPLAGVPDGEPLAEGVSNVLRHLTHNDAVLVYEAIQLAQPGGLGRVREQDVAELPRGTLLDVMRLAAERDQIAAQYADDFDVVLNFGAPYLARCIDFSARWEQAVIGLQLELMAHYPDTLIARKCGQEIARTSARRAHEVLEAGGVETVAGREKLHEFDCWLRADGNRRNPGTTADLITACLYAAFRNGTLQPPPIEQIRAQAARFKLIGSP